MYIGVEEKPKSFVLVLDQPYVTQIEILEDHHLVLRLADRVLTSYSLDLLDPNLAGLSNRGRKISSHVSFFKVGTCMDRTLVCLVKAASLSSTIKTLEPFAPLTNRKRAGLGNLFGSHSAQNRVKIFKVSFCAFYAFFRVFFGLCADYILDRNSTYRLNQRRCTF